MSGWLCKPYKWNYQNKGYGPWGCCQVNDVKARFALDLQIHAAAADAAFHSAMAADR